MTGQGLTHYLGEPPLNGGSRCLIGQRRPVNQKGELRGPLNLLVDRY